MPNQHKTAVILAAGDGVRMKSDSPKVLCEVLFKPMLKWVEDACRTSGIEDIVVVAGSGQEKLRKLCPECEFVTQEQRLGTGHALMTAKERLSGGHVLVLNGDGPLVSPGAIASSLEQHIRDHNVVTVLSAMLPDPMGYGRIVRNDAGLESIVEERDADRPTRQIREVNGGIYWMEASFLEQYLTPERFNTSNAQKEYYITDLIHIAQAEGLRADVHTCSDYRDILGANDRAQLARLNQVAKERVLAKHLNNGVDIPFSDGIVIGPDVQIEAGARILPGCILLGETRIASGCEIGPNSRLLHTQVGARTNILASWLTDCEVGADCSVGPYAQFRPGTKLGNGVKVGDFVELKNTTVGDHTSVAHLTYLGDCDIGSLCNFGCGVVTANYDGVHKYRTKVGDRAFIGCNTNLISPVNVGEGAYTAAGTTIDEDVPAGSLAIGRSRQEIKEGWADENIGFKKNP